MQINLSFLVRIAVLMTLVGVVCLPGCIPLDPCTVEYLILRINNANSTPVTTDTINLPAGCTYTLTVVNNNTTGNNGLPVITSPIIINGNGATIQRDPGAAEKFRLFYVSGDLGLNELTLTGGYAYNPAAPNDVSTNSGGAIRNSGHLLVTKSIIRENSGREGGGIFNINQMTLKDVTIDSNQDYFGLPGGAGIYNLGDAVLTNTTISNNGFNPAQPADGVFNAQGGHLEMTNSTVSHNAGCGIDNEGELTLNHVTMAFNFCGIASAGDVYTTNSIFGEGCGSNAHPTFPNLSPYAGCGGPVVPFAALELQPLAGNGGITETHALGAGSVAIDMVVRQCLPSDQRGVSRPQGPKCDVGAYEYVPPPAPVLNVTDTPTATVTSTTTPERKACIFTAKVNLFCRAGPGASLYRNVDEFMAGESAEVVAQSPDGLFVYVRGPNTGTQCVVSPVAKFGTLEGDCEQLLVFTPPVPTAGPTKPEKHKPPKPTSQSGCTVRQATGGLSCEVPCPPGADPGDPCTP
ncbi:MAG: right-handed parallel beta-helix repeat-containing protein [Anaerolineales bacterium]|nr:right-handed parallel beta-helix repeat-containing protein [Anaerolineales bacterium]